LCALCAIKDSLTGHAGLCAVYWLAGCDPSNQRRSWSEMDLSALWCAQRLTGGGARDLVCTNAAFTEADAWDRHVQTIGAWLAKRTPVQRRAIYEWDQALAAKEKEKEKKEEYSEDLP
jgi:hypothetical protein